MVEKLVMTRAVSHLTILIEDQDYLNPHFKFNQSKLDLMRELSDTISTFKIDRPNRHINPQYDIRPIKAIEDFKSWMSEYADIDDLRSPETIHSQLQQEETYQEEFIKDERRKRYEERGKYDKEQLAREEDQQESTSSLAFLVLILIGSILFVLPPSGMTYYGVTYERECYCSSFCQCVNHTVKRLTSYTGTSFIVNGNIVVGT